MPNTPGDGKSNPFGNGTGQTQGGTVPGNNFLTNPGGSGSRGTGRAFHDQQGAAQSPREAVADRDESTAAPGGLIPKVEATPTPGKDIGVGSIGNGNKPYRVGG